MPWSGIFVFVHVVALTGWALLLLAPRGPRIASYVLYLCVGLLCLAYTVMFASRLQAIVTGDFISIDGLKALFATDAGIVIGWTHYLAFDLFIGQWIAKDADHKGFSRLAQVPTLLLTLLAGPIGLLVWLIIRERRARAFAKG